MYQESLPKFKFKAPWWLPNGHAETIYAALKRQPYLEWELGTLLLPDSDFIDYGFLKGASNNWLLLCHGFEGSIQSAYIHSLAAEALKMGFSVFTWNYRGCSGRMNQQAFFYHSGATYDLHEVIALVQTKFNPKSISLAGFSLGGNLVLKYAGELGLGVWPNLGVMSTAAVSAPVDLAGSSKQIGKASNKFYTDRFLNTLRIKIKAKAALGIGDFNLETLEKVKTIWDFDHYFTAPLHGYDSAEAYYAANNSLQFLKKIKMPTLLISAHNDVMLSESCLPDYQFVNNPYLSMQYTQTGGHVGFFDGFNTAYDSYLLQFMIKNNSLCLL